MSTIIPAAECGEVGGHIPQKSYQAAEHTTRTICESHADSALKMHKLEKLESDAIALLLEHKTEKTCVSFSGGKDSLVALDLAVRVGIKKAVFSNTTIEYPETLSYIKSINDHYQIKLDIVRAPKDFFEIITSIGIPSRRMRWCCEVFKFGPIGVYGRKNDIDRFVTGLRRQESKKRATYDFVDTNPLLPIKQINPLLEWTTEDIWAYINKYKLPANPVYRYFDRVGCWCCPYRSGRDWAINKAHYPGLVNALREKLLIFARKVNIKDEKEFIDNRGWTAWASPTRKVTVGISRPCQVNSGNSRTVVFHSEDTDELKRISKFVGIISADFFMFGSNLRITLLDKYKKNLDIALEKAINCVGCGACLPSCKFSALILNQGKIDINLSKCVKCGVCVTSHNLRGGCISRNYSYFRGTLISAE